MTRAYSRRVDLLSFGRAPLGTSIELADYTRWLEAASAPRSGQQRQSIERVFFHGLVRIKQRKITAGIPKRQEIGVVPAARLARHPFLQSIAGDCDSQTTAQSSWRSIANVTTT